LESEIAARCERLAGELADANVRLVLAESCTAGLIAASLGAVPGISNVLCGSMVTYRDATKQQWLGVRPSVLDEHTAVSWHVAQLMVMGALVATPEADLAAAVTGHLGPNAPPAQDGLVFVGVGQRCPSTGRIRDADVREFRLRSHNRTARQAEAALLALDLLLQMLPTAGSNASQA
jgi:nicotinamide-nucleotide amidase